MGKSEDLDSILKGIDISPTMYRNAVDKYNAVAACLEKAGFSADIFPQGSFRTGTVARPVIDGVEREYDLDLICLVSDERFSNDPEVLRKEIGDALREGGYGDKLKEYDRCWTLDYADVSDIGFRLDIVPGVSQDAGYVSALANSGIDIRYAEEALKITEKVSEGSFGWVNSNPEGFALWFGDRNSRFAATSRRIQRQSIYEANRKIYGSVDDVPPLLERSSLQRAIQIMKRHRDMFYAQAHEWDERPISAILVSLAAKISQHAPADADVADLLAFIAEDLEVYGHMLLEGFAAQPYSDGSKRSYVQKLAGCWEIKNPVDGNDNYADSWTEKTARLFFKWAQALAADLADLTENGNSHRATMENMFGRESVDAALKPAGAAAIPVSAGKVKPWRSNALL